MEAEQGTVYLIGAGPGAADLLTIRALRAIERSQVLICDRILGEGFIDQLGIDLSGKSVEWLGHGSQGPERQAAINDRLAAAALAGQHVARIKNGDPLVFGRGAEEAEHLDRAGVRWEFIPGLSSAISTLTNAGYPVTNRGLGRSVAVVSARLAGGALNQRLPRAESIVVLMGFKVMGAVVTGLRADGWAMDTPAVVIERGAGPYEKRIAGTLVDIVERAAAAGVSSPALMAVGSVAERRYASPLRPRVLFLGQDAGAWRHLGDLLHWPALDHAGAPAPELAGRVPEHDVLCATTGAELRAWCAHHAVSGELWTLGAEAAAAAAELGLTVARGA